MRNSIVCHLRVPLGLSLILSSAAILWLALTFYNSATVSIASPVLKADGFGNYAFSILATFAGVGLPALLMLRPIAAGNSHQADDHKHLRKRVTAIPSMLRYMIPAIGILRDFLPARINTSSFSCALCYGHLRSSFHRHRVVSTSWGRDGIASHCIERRRVTDSLDAVLGLECQKTILAGYLSHQS